MYCDNNIVDLACDVLLTSQEMLQGIQRGIEVPH